MLSNHDQAATAILNLIQSRSRRPSKGEIVKLLSERLPSAAAESAGGELSITAMRRLVLRLREQNEAVELADFHVSRLLREATCDETEREGLRLAQMRLGRLTNELSADWMWVKASMRLCESRDLGEALTQVIAASTFVSLFEHKDEDLEHAEELLHKAIRGIGRATGVTAHSLGLGDDISHSQAYDEGLAEAAALRKAAEKEDVATIVRLIDEWTADPRPPVEEVRS